MKTATEVPAILTVHQMREGEYMLRVGDLKHRQLVVQVSKLLEDAETLIVVTPADIKVLRVSGRESSVAEAPRARAAADPSNPEELDEEMLEAIREEEQRQVPNEPPAEAEEVAPNGGAVVGKTAEGMKVVRRKRPTPGPAGHDEPCTRCRGTGKIKIIQDGGAAGETSCGVCMGAGVLKRYGARR